jgi:hypothetical protein
MCSCTGFQPDGGAACFEATVVETRSRARAAVTSLQGLFLLVSAIPVLLG